MSESDQKIASLERELALSEERNKCLAETLQKLSGNLFPAGEAEGMRKRLEIAEAQNRELLAIVCGRTKALIPKLTDHQKNELPGLYVSGYEDACLQAEFARPADEDPPSPSKGGAS